MLSQASKFFTQEESHAEQMGVKKGMKLVFLDRDARKFRFHMDGSMFTGDKKEKGEQMVQSLMDHIRHNKHHKIRLAFLGASEDESSCSHGQMCCARRTLDRNGVCSR